MSTDPKMNAEIKAAVQLTLDAVSVGRQIMGKQNFALKILPSLYRVVQDLPSVISNWSDLPAELRALPGTEQETDLVAYLVSNVTGIVGTDHAKAVLASTLKLLADLVEDALALERALKTE